MTLSHSTLLGIHLVQQKLGKGELALCLKGKSKTTSEVFTLNRPGKGRAEKDDREIQNRFANPCKDAPP